MTNDAWFHQRTPEGWVIRDENRLLVAVVPDTLHEREHDAIRIAGDAGDEREALTRELSTWSRANRISAEDAWRFMRRVLRLSKRTGRDPDLVLDDLRRDADDLLFGDDA